MRLIERYYTAAWECHGRDPEALSVMQLTIMQMWVDMDSVAVKLIPLLTEYESGFPPDLLNGLVLPKSEQMNRLARIENYVGERRASAGGKGVPWQHRSADGSWFEMSFAVRYYNSSTEHKWLHQTIVEAMKKVKVAEGPHGLPTFGLTKPGNLVTRRQSV